MANRRAQFLARVLGLIVLVAGLAGFLPNPLFGADGMFTGGTHLHVFRMVIGVMLLAFSAGGESSSASGLYLGASLLLFAAILGYLATTALPVGYMFGVVRTTRADNYLHGGLAVVLVICGMMNTSSKQLFWQ